MLILLPPSEGKTAPLDGAPVDPGALAEGWSWLGPELTAGVLVDAVPELSAYGAGSALTSEITQFSPFCLRMKPTIKDFC